MGCGSSKAEPVTGARAAKRSFDLRSSISKTATNAAHVLDPSLATFPTESTLPNFGSDIAGDESYLELPARASARHSAAQPSIAYALRSQGELGPEHARFSSAVSVGSSANAATS